MRRWKGYAAGLLLLAGLTPSVHAQVAGIPGGSTAATTTTPAVDGATSTTTTTTAAGGAAGAGNLWSYLCLTDAQKLRCKACLCSLPIVQLLGNATAGLSAMTGGVLGSTCCPGPYAATLADLAMPADSIAGAAGRVKLDEAEA